MFEGDEEKPQIPSWAQPVEVPQAPASTDQAQTNVPAWARPVDETPREAPTEPSREAPSWAQPIDQEAPAEAPQSPSEKRKRGTFKPDGSEGYGPSNLLEPDKLAVVDKFLNTYYGTAEIDGYEPQERVDKFINTWRYLEAGNTVKTLGFVDHVLSTDAVGRQSVAESYDLFQGMSGLTSPNYTWGETFDGIRDYAAGAIIDPVNIVAPLVGKVVGGTGSTAASKFAMNMARKEAARLASAGASKAVQQAAANKIKGVALQKATAKVGKAAAYKEVMGATVFDMAVAAGTDVIYQHGLVESDAIEEQDRYQTGLAALGGLVGGAISAAGVAVRGTSGLKMANVDVADASVTNPNDLKGVFKELTDSLDNLPENKFKEVFGDKVKRGTELEVQDTDFWGKLLLGDDQEGFKGLGQIMYDKGFRYLGERAEGDRFTNWLADAFVNSPSDEVLGFVQKFQEKTGVVLKGMDITDPASIADNLSRKMSDSGYALNKASQVAKMLKFKNVKDVTYNDYYAYLFGDVFGDSMLFETGQKVVHGRYGAGEVLGFKDGKFTVKFGDKGTKQVIPDSLKNPPGVMERLSKSVGEGTEWAQDSYVRLLVTHPGTSALNITGWTAKTIGQSASDIIRGTLIYGGNGTINTLRRNPQAIVDWKQMVGVYKANFQKMKNLIDPYTTAEAFNSLVDRNPEMFKDVVGVLPGGVVKSSAETLGIADASLPIYQQKGNKAIEKLQTMALVKAQDVFTKSQETLYNLDIAVRKNFQNMSLNEVLSRPDAREILSTRQWAKSVAEANDKTLDNIFSKSFAKHDVKAVSRVAGFIEDFRSIPVIGATIPFGRFFNNVVATASEYTGLDIILKATGSGFSKNNDWGETIAKPIVGWTAAAMLTGRESELLERGISWDEDIDESTGERYSVRYDAPYIGVKAMARWYAYQESGQEVPQEFIEDASAAIFGQLTRQLSQTGDAFLESTMAVLTGDVDQAVIGFGEMVNSLGGTLASGATRFMEPVNAIVALGASPQEYMAVDVKTGNAGWAKATRYMDSLISGPQGDVMERKAPTSEYVSRQPGRIAGQRPVGPTTAASRVFAMVGRPQWDADLYADDPVATNIVVGEFQPIFEMYAERLLKNPVFIKGDLSLKQGMISDALKDARELTHRTLKNSTNPDNPRMSLLFKLTQQNSINSLESKLGELGLEGTKLEELSNVQLEMLKYFIDNEKDIKERRAYGPLK